MAIRGQGGRAGQTANFQMNGLSMMQKSLKSLPDKLQDKAMKNASAAGAREIRKEARRLVPVGKQGAPHLRDMIVVSRTYKQRGRKRSFVGTVYLGIKGEGRYYAHLIEFGTSRSFAKPFMRPAIDNAFRRALQKMADKLTSEIAKQTKKLTGWKSAKQLKRLTR